MSNPITTGGEGHDYHDSTSYIVQSGGGVQGGGKIVEENHHITVGGEGHDHHAITGEEGGEGSSDSYNVQSGEAVQSGGGATMIGGGEGSSSSSSQGGEYHYITTGGVCVCV